MESKPIPGDTPSSCGEERTKSGVNRIEVSLEGQNLELLWDTFLAIWIVRPLLRHPSSSVVSISFQTPRASARTSVRATSQTSEGRVTQRASRYRRDEKVLGAQAGDEQEVEGESVKGDEGEGGDERKSMREAQRSD